MEARVGIEPTSKGFADPGLTTWLPRHFRNITRLLARSQFRKRGRNYRQEHVRIPLMFMVHRLRRFPRFLRTRVRYQTASVRIAIEARKITARNLYPNPMPREKYVACNTRIDRHLVILTRRHQPRSLQRIPVAHP